MTRSGHFKVAGRTFAGWLFLILAVFANAVWGAVGYVHEVSGDVRVQRGAAAAQPVKIGDTFDPGVTFRTATNGNVVIKFEDGQIASLRPNTAFRVDQYSYNARTPAAGNSAVSLLQGAARFVTGIIGATSRNNLRFAAGTATIGIRGTDMTVLVDATTQAVQAAIAAGAAVLQAPTGVSNIGVGQFASFTPGVFLSFLVMRALQLAQCMPVISRVHCSNVIKFW